MIATPSHFAYFISESCLDFLTTSDIGALLSWAGSLQACAGPLKSVLLPGHLQGDSYPAPSGACHSLSGIAALSPLYGIKPLGLAGAHLLRVTAEPALLNGL